MIIIVLSAALWAGLQTNAPAKPTLLACDILTGSGSEGCAPAVNLTSCYPADWDCGPELFAPSLGDADGPWLPT